MSHLSELSPVDRFVRNLFHPEDEVLRAIQTEIKARNKPAMNIGPEQGRALQVLMAANGSRRVLEIGSFFGYSAVWIARALPPGGRLTCLEASTEHAETTRRFLAQAGLADRVEMRTGQALHLLPALLEESPFDLIFLDADKANYAEYADWMERLLRPGGILVVDNAYLDGRIAQPELANDRDYGAVYRGMTHILRRLATDERWISTVAPYEDGLTVAVWRGVAQDLSADG